VARVLRWFVGPIVLAASLGLPSASVGAAQSKYGLLRASPTLSDRIELDSTHGVAGARLRGTLVVTNRGSRPINLTRRCYPGFLIELTNNHIASQVSFGSPCVNRALLIYPGTRRFAMTILTTEACTAAGGASALPIPTCPPTGGLPVLPPGRYRAVLVGDGVALPAPAPVTVTLVAGG
jgi:hypothetical protein